MEQREAIEVITEWGKRNDFPGFMLETAEAMRKEIIEESDKVTLREAKAFRIFCNGMSQLFHGRDYEGV